MSRRSRTCMLLGTAWVPFACFGLALAGCGNIYANPYPPIAPPPATASSAPASPQQATVVPVMTKEGLRHHAEDVLRQAESARQQAKDALALDGSPEAQGVYNEVAVGRQRGDRRASTTRRHLKPSLGRARERGLPRS